MAARQSKVFMREQQAWKTVEITGYEKPAVSETSIKEWQDLLNVLAESMDVPSALIMQLQNDSIKVFAKNSVPQNPYETGEEAKLIYGLYCENVIGNQQRLIVPNAAENEVWKENNPDVKINMVSYMGVPLNWPDQEVFGTVCVLDDKTNAYSDKFIRLLETMRDHIEADLQLMVNQDALKRINIDLQRANEVKSKFLSLISHDIRGSLGTQDLLLKTILKQYDSYSPEEIKEILQMLSQSVSSSYITLETMLTWSKQEVLSMKSHMQKTDLLAITRKVLSFFNHSVKFKQIKLLVQIPADPINISADPDMIETSIRNILSNAIKYTDHGGKVWVSLQCSDDGIELSIKDTGKGMTEETVNKLFSYDTTHQHGTMGEDSSGLGLMLCKEFLSKNDVAVKVKSALGEGTEFILNFKKV